MYSTGNDMRMNVKCADKNVMSGYGKQQNNNKKPRERRIETEKWSNKMPQRVGIQLLQ